MNSFLLVHKPWKLLFIATGNITNLELETLFFQHFDTMLESLADCDFVELDRTTLTIHR